MTDDGMPTAAEIRRLEAEADQLLKQDAKERGFIKTNGRGYSAYARSIGITTRKTLETTYKHEQAVSLVHKKGDFSMDERLDFLAHGMDKIEHGQDDREEDR